MKENKVLYKACKIIYTTLLKILYRPIAIGIENIQGDYYNVVGFPCYKFFELAKEITE